MINYVFHVYHCSYVSFKMLCVGKSVNVCFLVQDDDLTVTFSCLLDNNEYDETMTGQMNEKRSEGGVGGPQGGVPQGAAVDDTAVPPCGTPAGTATCPGSGVPPAHCYASTGGAAGNTAFHWLAGLNDGHRLAIRMQVFKFCVFCPSG